MAVTTAPSVEAYQAIVDRINAGTAYRLDNAAEYSEVAIDPLEEITSLRVDVVSESEEQLLETLAVEDRTSHIIRVWIRKKLADLNADSVNPVKLLVRQLYQQLNNWDSSDGRVRVWECDIDAKQVPDKEMLRQASLFVAAIVLRVEVEAST